MSNEQKRKAVLREWTLYSGYSTDWDAMKWYIGKESEITHEVGKAERIKVVPLSDYQALQEKLLLVTSALKDLREAQKAYISNRGNEKLGMKVGEMAKAADDVLALIEDVK